MANNVFMQLHGTKTFHLFPPTAAAALKVFPDAHPRARKSQLRLDFRGGGGGGGGGGGVGGSEEGAALDHPGHQVVTLKPGDALFIPAFWFHHVEAHAADTGPDAHRRGGAEDVVAADGDEESKSELEEDELDRCCVSLNVFSQARVTAAASRVLGVPPPSLPGGAEVADGQRWSAYARLVEHILAELGLPPSFPIEVYESRYAMLERETNGSDGGGAAAAGGGAANGGAANGGATDGRGELVDVSQVDDEYLALCARSYARKFRELDRTLEPEGEYRDGVRQVGKPRASIRSGLQDGCVRTAASCTCSADARADHARAPGASDLPSTFTH